MKTVKGKKWQRRTREQWQSIFARFSRSGLDIVPFCEREGISAPSFKRWRALLAADVGEARPSPAPASAGFIDAGLIKLGSSHHRFEIRLELGDGIVLHLARG